MHMRVVETGNGDAAGEIDDFRAGALQCGGLGRRARGENLAVTDRESLDETFRQAAEDPAIQ
ncbi:hypothetical protein D3C87_2125960 [compost metagenome]